MATSHQTKLNSFLTAILDSPWHKKFFYLLLLCLPLGGRLRLVNRDSLLFDRIGDYIVPELYGTDIILALLVFSWLISFIKQNSEKQIPSKHQKRFLIGFACLLTASLISLLSALNLQASLYKTAKLVEWGFLVWYIARQAWAPKDYKLMAVFLLAGACGQAGLGWYQFMLQKSLTSGTLAHVLGEQPISIWEQGISYIWAMGQKMIRPYGTFDHPNVLAGYLTMVQLIAFATLVKVWQDIRLKFILLILNLLILGTIVLTLSRIAWLCLSLAAVIYTIIYKRQILGYITRAKNTVRDDKSTVINANKQTSRLTYILGALALLAATTGAGYFMTLRIQTLWSYNQISLVGRMLLNSYAWQMFTQHPLGIGLANFTVLLRDFDLSGFFDIVIQPVHNIYLLLLSETGLLGLSGFVIILISCYSSQVDKIIQNAVRDRPGTAKLKIENISLLAALVILITIMFFDHYLWTLQQGQLLLWITLGFCLSRSSDSPNN